MRERYSTERLVMRRWQRSDAAQLLAAIETSLPALRRFTPWVVPEAPELATLEARLASFSAEFDAGESRVYGVFTRDMTRVIGQIGLYARVGPGAVELGYFVRSDAAGRGYATEAAKPMLRAAFEDAGVARVELRCEPDNVASIAIARKLGMSVRETVIDPGGTQLLVFECDGSQLPPTPPRIIPQPSSP